MKKLLFSVVFAFLASISFAQNYKVVGIKDGDTFVVLSETNEQKTIRLANIDAPEKKQSFGTQAKKFASDLCFGKMVTLKEYETDRYGRTIAEVFLNGKSVNRSMVENGYAWHYKRYSHDLSLDDVELKAREKKLGLWVEASPQSPEEFRKSKRKN